MDSNRTTNFSDRKTLEKYSSAFTLSDMEIFIFPELFYPLVLANIMSPVIWKWRDDPWFREIDKKNFTYKVNRIKQYIIQNYIFNLDLSTWGLTTKTKEINRFSDFFDMELLKKSNALFGYEGDKYYFDIDIRKHFGLDKFNSDIIPYWKTETVEAMNAFRFKENFSTGAGECVSLSALYAAAMFIIAKIPLEKIFLIATPLHSQNFIMEKEGLITNNRRIVTKNMWYNGTSLSEKARRAMENENITIVSHISGFIHTLYEDATIKKDEYDNFSAKLRGFLETELTSLIFVNFLRFKSKYKNLFQYECENSGRREYISLEKMFEYEHTSKYTVSSDTRGLLIKEIEGEEFHLSPIQGKIMLNDVEKIFHQCHGKNISLVEKEFMRFSDLVSPDIIHDMFSEISDFISINPRIPSDNKNYKEVATPHLSYDFSREKNTDAIIKFASKSEMCELALYVFRNMDRIDWKPFIKAALERNPVSLPDLEGKTIDDAYNIIARLPNISIYDGNRLALPDEVWNFKRGEGIEKALVLANFILKNDERSEISIDIDKKVQLSVNGYKYQFVTNKTLKKSIRISFENYQMS